MGPLGMHFVEPANTTGPFIFARQTPSGPEAIQKLDTTKEKNRSRLAETTEAADFDSQVLWNQIIDINSQPMATNIIFSFFLLWSAMLNYSLLMSFPASVVSASRFNFTPSGLPRGIYVWWVMAGNFNVQLIIRLNKWGSCSTFPSQWQVTFTGVAELWICLHCAGLLELLRAMYACRCSKLSHSIGLFLYDSTSLYDFWNSYLVPKWRKENRRKEELFVQTWV